METKMKSYKKIKKWFHQISGILLILILILQLEKKRFENIIVQLIDNGFLLGPWAQKIYDQVKNNKDSARGVTNSIPEDIPGVSGNVSAQTQL